MKYIFAAALAVTCLASCDEPKQNPMEDAPTDEMKTEEFGAFEGDLSFDAAHDELAIVIEGIVKRNDELAELTATPISRVVFMLYNNSNLNPMINARPR